MKKEVTTAKVVNVCDVCEIKELGTYYECRCVVCGRDVCFDCKNTDGPWDMLPCAEEDEDGGYSATVCLRCEESELASAILEAESRYADLVKKLFEQWSESVKEK